MVPDRFARWQRLCIAGFIPWVILNGLLYERNEGWLWGYWSWSLNAIDLLLPPQPNWWLVPFGVLALVFAFLVPYVVLCYLLNACWHALMRACMASRRF